MLLQGLPGQADIVALAGASGQPSEGGTGTITTSLGGGSGGGSGNGGLQHKVTKAEPPVSMRKVHKADREKLRRDKLNEQFEELASMLDPDRPKNDKATILGDSVAAVRDLREEVKRLRCEHSALLTESKELSHEKLELREERAALKSESEQLQEKLQERVRSMLAWMAATATASSEASAYPQLPLQPLPAPYPAYGLPQCDVPASSAGHNDPLQEPSAASLQRSQLLDGSSSRPPMFELPLLPHEARKLFGNGPMAYPVPQQQPLPPGHSPTPPHLRPAYHHPAMFTAPPPSCFGAQLLPPGLGGRPSGYGAYFLGYPPSATLPSHTLPSQSDDPVGSAGNNYVSGGRLMLEAEGGALLQTAHHPPPPIPPPYHLLPQAQVAGAHLSSGGGQQQHGQWGYQPLPEAPALLVRFPSSSSSPLEKQPASEMRVEVGRRHGSGQGQGITNLVADERKGSLDAGQDKHDLQPGETPGPGEAPARGEAPGQGEAPGGGKVLSEDEARKTFEAAADQLVGVGTSGELPAGQPGRDGNADDLGQWPQLRPPQSPLPHQEPP
eukprot:SM000038S14290  [mRNA]  locus=s38:44697:46916:- [translate_table: standard]